MARKTLFRSFILAVAVLAAGSVALADWNEGLSAFDAGNFKVAAEHFTEITRTNPTWPGGYYMLGRCLAAQEQGGEEKFTETRKLLENTDTTAMPPVLRSRATILLAGAMLGEDDAQAAVTLLQVRLREDKANSALYRTLGKAQAAAGDRESSCRSFSKAFKLNSEESSGVAATSAALALAVAAVEADEKSQWYQQALEIGSQLATSFPDLRYDLMVGQAALGAEDLDSAETWFRAAVSKNEKDPQAQYSLGRTLVSLGRDTEAYQAFSKALAAAPDEDLTKRIHSRMAHIAACRLDLEAAAAHYFSAQQKDRAQEIENLVTQYAEALTHREKLRATVKELQQMERELEDLGDAQGVAAVNERATTERAKITEIENNLEAVRSALCQ